MGLEEICIGYNNVWSELCECNEQTHSRQCCNLLISWPVNVGDVFIEAWLLVWLVRPICERLCRTLCTLTPDKLSAVSCDPLTHSIHNAGDRSVNVWNKYRLQKFTCHYNLRKYLFLSRVVNIWNGFTKWGGRGWYYYKYRLDKHSINQDQFVSEVRS